MVSRTGADGAVIDPESFLDRIVEIDGTRFERLRPITDYRRDPGEARILYLCRRAVIDTANGYGNDDGDLVMKVKVQYVCLVPCHAAVQLTTIESLHGQHRMTQSNRSLDRARPRPPNGRPCRPSPTRIWTVCRILSLRYAEHNPRMAISQVVTLPSRS